MGAIPQRGRRLAAPVVAADAQQAAARIVGTHSPRVWPAAGADLLCQCGA